MIAKSLRPWKLAIAAAAVAFSAMVALPHAAFAKSFGIATPGVVHIYVFSNDEKELQTYAPITGTINIVNADAVHTSLHPTLKDKNGKACTLVTIDPEAGKQTLLSWTGAYGDDPGDLVVEDQHFVLCDQQLPNHDQLPYPPD